MEPSSCRDSEPDSGELALCSPLEPDTGEADSGGPDTGEADSVEADGGGPDTGEADSGRPDTGEADSGRPDTGEADSVEADGGGPDTGEADSVEADGGGPDTGEADSVEADGGGPDTGETDSGGPDTGEADSGEADGGGPDTGEADSGRPDTGEADSVEADGGGPDTGEADSVEADGGGPDTGETDSGGPDTEVADGVEADSGGPDTGEADSGEADGGGPDTGEADSGGPDTGEADSGGPDTGEADSGGPDTGEADSGGPDTGEADGGEADSGGPDTGEADGGELALCSPLEPDTGEADSVEADGGGPDTGEADSGGPDTGEADSGEADGGGPDTREADSGGPDTGEADSVEGDGGGPDTGEADSGELALCSPLEPDSGEADSGEADSVEADSGEADSVEADSGEADSVEADSGEADSGEADSGEADSGEADSVEADSGEADSVEADSGEADSGEAGSGEADSGEPARCKSLEPDVGQSDIGEPALLKPLEPDQIDCLRVRVGETIFVVDKALLTRHSEYFQALFLSGMRECQQEEIHVRDLGAVGFLTALRVLNGERPALSGDEIVEAIECAAFLQVDALTKHLVQIVNSDNCVLVYHTAAAYGLWQLSHSAALFIRDMICDLREELGALPRELVDYVECLTPSKYMVVCSHSPTVQLLQDSQRTVCYLDEDERNWKVLTQLPMNASTTMAGVTVLDNKLYIVGGVHDVSKKVVDTGFCYSPESSTWTLVPSPLQPRYNFSLVGHEGCLYALGGEFERKAMSSVERYRVSTGTWSPVSPLPSPLASVVSAKAMNRIFISLWKSKGATQIHEYLPEKDRWVVETTLVRDQSYGHCMVAHRDNLYMMRNGPGEDFLLCVMDRYNLTSGQWTAVTGQYGNSKGALFTAVVRGDSVFTLNRKVTTEYSVEEHSWRIRREMTGFGRIGSMHTFLLRLPQPTTPPVGRSQVLVDGLTFGNRDNHTPRSLLKCLE